MPEAFDFQAQLRKRNVVFPTRATIPAISTKPRRDLETSDECCATCAVAKPYYPVRTRDSWVSRNKELSSGYRSLLQPLRRLQL